MLSSLLTLVPKPGKDLQDCANYRPIALLNTDLKLFTKLLANRLNAWLPLLVHKDQVGFIPCRQGGDNTRRTVDLVEVANHYSTPALLLSLDAEKAFDRIDWSFMHATLKAFGLTGPFLTAIQALYSLPTAAIKLPHASSPFFPIRNGTRQGCPLSPIIFALCIEPLAAKIRRDPDIKGIMVQDKEFKVSLFADDVLLTLTSPHTTLPNLLRLLETYGDLSGYKVNPAKTEALPLNIPRDLLLLLRSNYDFQWRESSIRYLGVHISTSYATLYSANYPRLFRELRALLDKWQPLPISLLGRITAVKMTLLPKLLYFFETLPVAIPRGELRNLQKAIFQFIWQAKRHRIPRSVMLADRGSGGMAVPHLLHYYWASHLRHIPLWAAMPAYTRWVQIEKLWLAPMHPNALLWVGSPPTPPASYLLGPIRFTRSIWSACCTRFSLMSRHSSMVSILYNPLLPESLTSAMTKVWSKAGLYRIADMVDPGTLELRSFAYLTANQNLPGSEWFHYLQVVHFVRSLHGSLKVSLPTAFEKICRAGTSTRGLISSIYQLLTSQTTGSPVSHRYMLKWEEAVGGPISQEQWRIVWSRAQKSSQCITFREAQYKLLMHWYHTPALLHALNPLVPPWCWRCGAAVGTLHHIFWTCPLILGFWREVRTLTTALFLQEVPLDPLVYLLNLPPRHLSNKSSRLFLHLCTAAKTLIARNWKKVSPPSGLELVARVKDVRSLEYLTAGLNNSQEAFGAIWAPWDMYCTSQGL